MESIDILTVVNNEQADENTKFHCLYGFYYLGLSTSNLSIIYKKSIRTIQYWISRWENYRTVNRLHGSINPRKVNHDKQMFILELYNKYPLIFLDEARFKFIKTYKMNISCATIWRIISSANLTRKIIERRAINISIADIFRYFNELNNLSLGWSYDNIIFLDEVGFDNKDMLRKRGYAIKGQRIIYRGEFTRKERSSLLCFLGVNGIAGVYSTVGTFDRLKFMAYCRDFALMSGKVHQYPGTHSIWIMDGASIHCDPNITNYLRSLGIITIYLPAYCPFYNPIEIVFGNIKSILQRNYVENRSFGDMKLLIASSMDKLKSRNIRNIFKKCGYISSGSFDPGQAFQQDIGRFGF